MTEGVRCFTSDFCGNGFHGFSALAKVVSPLLSLMQARELSWESRIEM